MNLTFLLPRSAYIVSMLSRIYFHEDSFLTGAVPYYQKPIALFRRFVFLIWNSLFFINSYHLDRFGHSAAASPANW